MQSTLGPMPRIRLDSFKSSTVLIGRGRTFVYLEEWTLETVMDLASLRREWNKWQVYRSTLHRRKYLQIKDTSTWPGQRQDGGGLLDFELNIPIFLYHERRKETVYFGGKSSDEIVSLNNKSESRGLAGAIGNDGTIQVSIFA